MADITITPADVKLVKSFEQYTAPAGEVIDAGELVYIDPTTGHLLLADASAAGTARAWGMALTNAAVIGQTTTVVRKGIIDVGNGLGGLTYDHDLWVSITAGKVCDTAPVAPDIIKVVGQVLPAYGFTTPDKLLFIDL